MDRTSKSTIASDTGNEMCSGKRKLDKLHAGNSQSATLAATGTGTGSGSGSGTGKRWTGDSRKKWTWWREKFFPCYDRYKIKTQIIAITQIIFYLASFFCRSYFILSSSNVYTNPEISANNLLEHRTPERLPLQIFPQETFLRLELDQKLGMGRELRAPNLIYNKKSVDPLTPTTNSVAQIQWRKKLPLILDEFGWLNFNLLLIDIFGIVLGCTLLLGTYLEEVALLKTWTVGNGFRVLISLCMLCFVEELWSGEERKPGPSPKQRKFVAGMVWEMNAGVAVFMAGFQIWSNYVVVIYFLLMLHLGRMAKAILGQNQTTLYYSYLNLKSQNCTRTGTGRRSGINRTGIKKARLLFFK